MMVNIDGDDSHEDADDNAESACMSGVGDVFVVLLHQLARLPTASCLGLGQALLVPVLLFCRGYTCSG